jgi:methionine-rich copper-binding protein CopC
VLRITLAVWVAVVALAPVAASALVPPATHARLKASNPVEDSVLAQAPASVVLTFSRDVSAPAAVAVTSPSGDPVGSGEPVVLGTEVSLPVTAAEEGTYTVGYRVVTVDGHTIEGSYQFSVGHVSATKDAPATDDGSGWVLPVASAGALLVIGAGAWRWRRRRTST